MSHQLPVSLSDEQIEAFGRELDAIQAEVKASLGANDRRYIKRMITIQRSMAFGGRLLIFASLPLMPAFPLFLGVIGTGSAMLGLSKILENMEVGHNVMHGQ
jgi:linoleoyl-CoA desaturase